MNLPKQSVRQRLYAAAAISTSVAGDATLLPRAATNSSRLSRRPSHIITFPALNVCGWLSSLDSLVV